MHSAATGEATVELLCLRDLADLARAEPPDAARAEHLAARVQGPMAEVAAAHVVATVAGDGAGLLAAADGYERLGALPWAAGAAAAAGERLADPRAATAARRRAVALLARCPGHRPADQAGGPSGAAAEALSDREREVAALAAAGRTDKAIAEALFLSTRTVGNHLLRVYRKLGIRGRDELARALAQHE